MIAAERHQVAVKFSAVVAIFDVIQLDVVCVSTDLAGFGVFLVVLLFAQLPRGASRVIAVKQGRHRLPRVAPAF